MDFHVSFSREVLQVKLQGEMGGMCLMQTTPPQMVISKTMYELPLILK